jgi:bifunctional enzyme CysN/CysC
VSDQFAAHLLWMAEDECCPGRQYLLKIGTAPSRCPSPSSSTRSTSTRSITWRQDAALNEVGYCNISAAQPIAFDAYADNRDTGGFILIDRFTNATVAAGMIDFGLRRATNVHWQALDVNKTLRAEAQGPEAGVLWFTGLSGSGKSTIANLVEAHCSRRAVTPICSTATMSATASTAIWASPMSIGWRTSAAWPRRPGCSSMRA